MSDVSLLIRAACQLCSWAQALPFCSCHRFLITPPGGRGIGSIDFLSAGLRENGWTDLHEIFKEGVEWPREDLNKFRVNSGKWVGGSVNLLSPDIAIRFDCCLLAVMCCHLAIENIMKLLFFGLLLHRNTGAGFVVLRTTACFLIYFSA